MSIFHFIVKLSSVFPFLLILSTVFVTNKHLINGVVNGKYFWFYLSMGLGSVVTLIYFLISQRRFRFSLTDIYVLLFVCCTFLTSCVFNDANANFTKLVLLVLLFVLYICLRLLFENDNKTFLNFVCIFIILTGLIEAIWGLQQLYGFKYSQHSLFKLTGSFFNPGPYAGYLAAVLPLALQMLTLKNEELRYKKAGQTWANLLYASYPTLIYFLVSLASLLVILLVIPATMSRASWLAAITGSMVVIIGKYRSSLLTLLSSLLAKKWLKTSIFIFSLCFLFVIFSGLYYLKKDSADGRLLTWKVSLQAVIKHPFGVGLGHFPSAYGDAQAAYFASGNASEIEKYVAGNPEYGFNEYLQIAIESGIIGLLLFIGVIFCAFRGLIRSKSWGVMGSLVALLVFAFFSYPFSVLPFPILLVFLLAMSDIKINNEELKINRVGRSILKRLYVPFPILIFSLIVLCSFTAFCLWKQYPVYQAYKQWNSHRIYYQNGIYKEVAKSYEPLYPYLNNQIQFLFEYGRSLSQLGNNDSQGMADQARHGMLIKSNEVLQRATQVSCDPMLYNIMGKNHQAMKEYDLAEQNLLKSTLIVPNRIYPYYLLMKLFDEKGDEDKASKYAQIVLTKEPKVHSRAVEEMREEARKIKTKN